MLRLLEVTANGIVMRKASVPKNTNGLLEKSLKNLLDLRSETSNTDLTERAFIVRSSVDLLREVFGEIYNDEVLDSVFNGFCVGK